MPNLGALEVLLILLVLAVGVGSLALVLWLLGRVTRPDRTRLHELERRVEDLEKRRP